MSLALTPTKPRSGAKVTSNAISTLAIGSEASGGMLARDSPSRSISKVVPNFTVSRANDSINSNELNRTPAAIQYSP